MVPDMKEEGEWHCKQCRERSMRDTLEKLVREIKRTREEMTTLRVEVKNGQEDRRGKQYRGED